MSQLNLAKVFKLSSSQFISLIERGGSKLPLDMAGRMTKELNIPLESMELALIKDYQKRVQEVL